MKLIRSLFFEIDSWFSFLIIGMPNNSLIGIRLRRLYWQFKIKKLGINPLISRMAKIYCPILVDIGDNFILGENAVVDPCESKGLFIGNNVSIAQGSFIRAANHRFDILDSPINSQGHSYITLLYRDKEYSIVIEDDVWLGANVILLSGAKIGKGSVISAGSVVSNEIPPNSIVAGNPGRVIANRVQKFGKKNEAI